MTLSFPGSETHALPVLLQRLNFHIQLGNINRFIQTALDRFNDLAGVRTEILETVRRFLIQCPETITPETLRRMTDFMTCTETGMETATSWITEMDKTVKRIQSGDGRCPPPLTDTVDFPVAGATGAVFRLRIHTAFPDGCGPSHSASTSGPVSPVNHPVLDRAGRLAVSLLNQEERYPPLLWQPDAFELNIENTLGRGISSIQGDSHGAAVLLGVYARLTNQQMPADISVSARLGSDGTLGPVSRMEQKCRALIWERHRIKTLFIARQQTVPPDIAPLTVIRVNTVRELVRSVFPYPSASTADHPRIFDMTHAGTLLKTQYRQCRMDTCLNNARILLRTLEQPGTQPLIAASPGVNPKGLQFFCLWKIAACLCHQGDVTASAKGFRNAMVFYKHHAADIDLKDYLEACNNYAVLLKDLYCYDRAEKIHHRIHQELKHKGITRDEVGKNLSSLSQLMLARRRYTRAEALQLEAVNKVQSWERWRNYGYLAQIYARMGCPEKADNALENARKGLAAIPREQTGKMEIYFDWIRSEVLWRRIDSVDSMGAETTDLEKGYRQQEPFRMLARQYPVVDSYVSGLILKFCGLGLFATADTPPTRKEALDHLQKSQAFFDAAPSPVLKMLGISVRIETLLNTSSLIQQPSMIDTCEDKNLKDHLDKIHTALTLHPAIKHHFQPELDRLATYIETPDLQDPGGLLILLKQIRDDIPY